MPGFMGIPYVFWGIGCLGIAGLYTYLWPRPRSGAPPRRPFTAFVLRWFHPLVWVILAAAAFLTAAGQTVWGQRLAPLALGAYIVFMFSFTQEKRSRTLVRRPARPVGKRKP